MFFFWGPFHLFPSIFDKIRLLLFSISQYNSVYTYSNEKYYSGIDYYDKSYMIWKINYFQMLDNCHNYFYF